MTTIQTFCGLTTNGSFTVYDDITETFGRCFLWTCIATPVYLLLAVQCAYLVGVSKPFSSIRTSFLVAAINNTPLFLGLSSLLEVILCYSLDDGEEHPPAYSLSKGVSFVAWMLCFLLQYKVNSITRKKKQNTKYILPVIIFTLISSSMQLQYVLNRDSYSDQFRVDYYGSIVDFSLTLIFFLLCVLVSVSNIKTGHPYKDLDEDNVIEEKEINLGQAEVTRNYFSRIVYWWADKLLWKGMKRQLRSPDDLFTLPDSLNTLRMKARLKEMFNDEKEKYLNSLSREELREHYVKRKSLKLSLFHVLNRCFGKVYYSLAILKLLSDTCQLVQPTFVNFLVTFVSDKSQPMSNGYYYALGFFSTSLLSVLFDLHYKYNIKKINLQVRAALVSVIYEKTLAIRSSSINKTSTGNIVNLMSMDTDRVCSFCDTFHECWSVPFQIIVCLYLLYAQVGIAVVAVVAFCFLVIPVASRIYKQVNNYQTKVLTERDKRIKIICEILFGIRIIKYNAWEDHFKTTVNEARKSELKYNLMTKWYFAGMIWIWGNTVPIVSILSIGTYVLMGNPLDAAKVFTTMAVIENLVNPLNGLSWNIGNVIDAWVSVKRIQTFLCLPEMRLHEYYTKGVAKGNLAVKIKDCHFCWNLKKEEKEPEYITTGCCCCKTVREKEVTPGEETKEAVVPFELKDISFSVKHGQFIGVTGKVGSGKSSLFASITAEMEKEAGEVDLNEKLDGIAYVTQDPWIQHMSIRDNILFGRPYDEDKYNEVLYACALNDDINLFSAGDLTEVGESGVNLSGGQKARLALARAVYQNKDMYLLDDPIAAVDAHVAKHLYKNCFNGLLKDKTRVLSTHHTKFLLQCDHVVLLQDGAVHSQGLPDDVLEGVEDVEVDEDTKEDEEGNEKEDEGEGKDKQEGKLIEDEDQRTGTLSFQVYLRYFKAFGTLATFGILLTITLRQGTNNFQDWWLSHWVEQTKHYEPDNGSSISDDDAYYLSVYGYLIIASFLLLVVETIIQPLGSIHASRGLHQGLLNAVMDTPIPFFDMTPVGRIVNRFSTDISDIDDSLPNLIEWALVQVACIVGMLILTVYSLPWFAIMIVPLGLLYFFIQLVYRRSSRELKRISSVSRSPLYEHFTETLSGYMVIRAFRDTERFIKENEKKLDRSQRAEYNENLASMWLTFRLDMIGVIMVTSISILAVLEHQFGSTEAGLVGLAITYSLQITPLLGGMLTVLTETEKQMIRVERVTQYIEETPREEKKSKNVPSSWPANGRVMFNNVSFQYRENLPMALQRVNLDIKAGEKIGICGRTGSGKSTILKVLFNIVDVNSGSVLIDGVDSSKVDFSILRSRMSIIPQDPFLFNDTVSKNLDPAQKFSTYEMMDVLAKCHLTKLVEDIGGLEGNVGEKGSNLSAGQKQLLCLARALLKKSKIICIDEATASVDLETDKLIQVTIREEFVENTVLTIAHRMNTIIDSDRVLVMEAGRVLEFAPPDELLADPSSEFYSLVNESSSAR